MPDNHLYYGDNLDVLRRYVKDESVEEIGVLICIEKPTRTMLHEAVEAELRRYVIGASVDCTRSP